MHDTVLTRLRNWISGSGLSRGDRMPPERTLCETLGVSRAELRKALLVLETEGILDRNVGRGTFLAKAPRTTRGGDRIDRSIATLSESTGPVEAMNARLAFEPQLCQLAALHATPKQLRDLRRMAQAMREATNWSNYEQLDSDFHEAIAAASGNGLLQSLHRILNGVRLAVVWRRLNTSDRGPHPNYHSFDEHDAILAALESRDPTAAGEAMRAHLESTLSQMTAASRA